MSGHFEAASNSGLRRAGIEGTPTVRLEGDALIISGAKEGRLSVRSGTVKRLLIACSRVRAGPLYETRIWREGEEEPLLLVPRRSLQDKLEDYPEIIRDFARRVEEQGGIDRIGIGRGAGAGRVQMMVGLALVLVLALFSLLLAIAGNLWPLYAVAAFFLLMFIWGCRLIRNGKMEAPIGSLRNLEPELDYRTKIGQPRR